MNEASLATQGRFGRIALIRFSIPCLIAPGTGAAPRSGRYALVGPPTAETALCIVITRVPRGVRPNS